jgi:uncharacterized protein (TIGR03083 family)
MMHDPFIQSLMDDASLIDDVLSTTQDSVAIPTCPGWTVRDLVEHLGSEHIWVADLIENRVQVATRRVQPTVEAESLRAWYRSANERLRSVLAETPPTTRVWNVNGDNVVGSWRRRQAHETAIHRFDLEYAAGQAHDIDEVLAESFLDELGTFLPFLHKFLGLAIPDEDLILSSVESSWTLEAGTGTIRNGPPLPMADIIGSAGSILLALWDRPHDAEINRPALLTHWQLAK